MPAGQEVAAAQLVDEERSLGAGFVSHIGQLEDPVDHGVLGWHRLAFRGGEEKHRATVQSGLGLKLLDEGLELGIRCRPVLRRHQSVQDHDVRPMRRNLAPDERHQPGQPFAFRERRSR